jgi:hypothetical protein
MVLGLLASADIIHAKSIDFIEKDADGKADGLTAYGIVMAVITFISLVGGLISIILLFTMRSPRSVTKDVYKLTSSAIPGKRTTKHSAREIKARI